MTRTDAERLALREYWETAYSLLGLIRGERGDSRTASDRRSRAVAKLARVQALLAHLGNPHRRFPIIHITGTSGKGSTAAIVAAILTASGYRVGLRTSPYLQVATEKLQIGPALIDAPSFTTLTRAILAEAATLYRKGQLDQPCGYAEIWTALAFRWFAEQNIDIAVVEVGAGGRFDTTNVIEPLVSVITSVGMDHVLSLGPTVADIAWHKAGIIKPGSVAVLGNIPGEPLAVITAEAKAVGARVIHARDVDASLLGVAAMPGQFQQANAGVAIGVVEALRMQGVSVGDPAIPAGLATARLPGRLEKMPVRGGPAIWLDGAHNADKIAALAREAPALSRTGELPVIVLGVLGAKDTRAIAREVIPVASTIVATQPTVVGKRSLPSATLARSLRDRGFAGDIVVEPNPDHAMGRAAEIACAADASVLVTGSMYLAGQARSNWYPDDEVVLQRTAWPIVEGDTGPTPHDRSGSGHP